MGVQLSAVGEERRSVSASGVGRGKEGVWLKFLPVRFEWELFPGAWIIMRDSELLSESLQG